MTAKELISVFANDPYEQKYEIYVDPKYDQDDGMDREVIEIFTRKDIIHIRVGAKKES